MKAGIRKAKKHKSVRGRRRVEHSRAKEQNGGEEREAEEKGNEERAWWPAVHKNAYLDEGLCECLELIGSEVGLGLLVCEGEL